MAELQTLPGIGPFYSALVVVRACGLTDVLSTQEGHSRAAVRSLYGLDHDPDEAELTAIAEAWRPFRTWAAVVPARGRDTTRDTDAACDDRILALASRRAHPQSPRPSRPRGRRRAHRLWRRR